MDPVAKQGSERLAAVTISAVPILAVTISGGKGEEDGRGESINSKIGSKDY